MSATVNVNGTITDGATASISVFDRGFLFGEGVYETIRTYNRLPFLFDRHMDRLRRSAARIDLACPLDDAGVHTRIIETIAAGAAEGEAYVRLLLTRGVGDISYDPKTATTPSLVIIVKPLPEVPAEFQATGVAVSLVSVVRNHPDSVHPAIKSNNLLNNALAMQQALQEGTYEALMRNYQGDLVECSQSNFFIVRDGTALTPPLDAGLLEGITRNFVFEVGAAIDVPVAEAVLQDGDLATADEAFLTSTTREIVPIVKVGARTIGAGQPGPVTLTLLAELRRTAAALNRTT
ncbi:MAG: aminotransferase class IV [Vicinamibacterales bacterium]|jgi:branched-chain amino acid aminotransferase|nr:branched-chain amino acid aminotransferase [Acidobacteriota bacterium]MDP7294681.1 aminotransferase class IV [Vicinamibacterales bacterium]MDP7471130.1 aminotransferase class IV [Vicinamibacterales bacterium]MDP7671905.1 aminotransferase class IV [Vicinamibacterales bacterium]HJO37894.1 aminotransferase class IV [Vicinamibacterales bacterium]|tara:strand:- start:130 stop:1005 length:876 start_codon:yes stop_codon:yes gene_type:complete